MTTRYRRLLMGACLATGSLTLGWPTTAAGQDSVTDEARWNAPRVLRLVERARSLRSSTAVHPDVRSYQGEARGYVYFYVDRPDSAETMLVKVDQVALDLWYEAPGTTRQRIVGMRDQKLLPTSIRYHLDHLTVVQDDFGDFIELGDGDEVEAVVHPVGPRAEDTYDYQLSDSLSIRYGAAEEIRVYAVRVRPRRMDEPGFVGTIYLDRARAAVVRMNFSFTPASYVDPYLDYIRVSTDNSLWLGSWWLPYRQEIEIRRETPFFDFTAGSTIRTTFDVGAYDFNVEVPEEIRRGAPVTTVSPSRRRTFPFERDLFDDIRERGGIVPSPSLEEVREDVQEVVESEVMSGLDPLRLHLSRLSDFARYNRAEGIFVGAGLSLKPRGETVARVTGGWSFGRTRASGMLSLTRPGLRLDGYWDRMADIGGHTGATPLENSISSASGQKDYFDPVFTRGGALSMGVGATSRWSLTVRVEEQQSAADVVTDGTSDFRPVRSAEEGTAAALTVGHRLGLPGGGGARLSLTGGAMNERGWVSAVSSLDWALQDSGERWKAEAHLEGGITNPGAPPQALFLLGGRHTLLGHPYRLFEGNAYWMARIGGTVPLRPPMLGLRAFAVLGSTYLSDETVLPGGWGARDSAGLRGTVGLGLAIGWDAIRFDVGRAVWGTGWEAMVSFAPEFRSWL